MEKESQKGGVSNLIKRIKLKYPNLTLDECIEYIESAKESIGGSFSGIEMKDVELLVKLEMKQDEKKKEEKKILDENICAFCFKELSNKWECKRHMEKAHINKEIKNGDNVKQKSKKEIQAKDFQCKICGKQYKYAFNLKRHMSEHQEEDRYDCKYCGKSFARRDTLLRHAQILHKVYQKIDFEAASSQSVKSFKCQMCNMDFGMEKQKFNAHLAFKVCQQSRFGKADLDEENRFACDHCEKSYVEKTSLLKHIRWKHQRSIP